MKILHIIDGLPMGGAENLLIGLAGRQKAQGNDVTVIPLVCASHTPVRDKLVERGVKVMPLSGKGSCYNPLFIFKIVRIIHRYDIVHVHLFPALYWAGFAKLFSFRNVPLVYTEHSTKNRRRANIFLHAIDRFVYKNGYDRIIACSEKALETYKSAYPTITHVCAINNGVDTSVYREARPYSKKEMLGIDESCFVVTMVARFMTMKRQDTIIEALAKLPDYIHAVFVGGTENDDGLLRIKKIAEKYNVAERAHFLYTRKDVPKILKTSDVIIMASDYEGLSLSSIEGMAAGKPFIASDVDGLREVVGGAGILFKNKDSETLSQIILKLATDNIYYQDVSKKCSQRATMYDIKSMVDSYLKMYNEVLTK